MADGVPTLVIAGTGSGSGKTTVVCAVACALAERGVDVRLFKAGPDYLDPTFHQAATGRAGRNLDPWMTGMDGLARAFAAGTRDLRRPGVAIVEGVMGLYDGRRPDSLEGSTAALAQALGAPVVLVVDAAGAARSAVPVVEGFANHVPDVAVRGVIWNRVGSAGHTALIEEAMASARTRLPVASLGGLPRNERVFLPSRHLGLTAAHVSEATRTEAARTRWRRELAASAGAHLDLDRLLSLAEGATPPPPPPPRPPVAAVRIGIARDAAFHFYYPDNIELLEEAGATLVPFSPLSDTTLPTDLDGLFIGGGYPEEHAAALSANTAMRAAIADLARRGRPVYGECGGLMYLGRQLVDRDGRAHDMVGALPVVTAMEPGLRALGYREVTATRDTLLGPAGTRYRGHEFHYSGVIDAADCPTALRWSGRRGTGTCGYVQGPVLASYIHAHFGSNPELPRTFVRTCAEARR
ncbi:MAG: cobyrinate a,c-diamide synthase [Deltaproteobacteria bacterium]|nr:MAG: cobyrinate a,c-diamide synthase [Deltaproteobacteria bacterium]